MKVKLEEIDDVGNAPMEIYTEITAKEKEKIREKVRESRTEVEKKIKKIEVFDENLDVLKIYVTYKQKYTEQKEIYLKRSELDED